VLRRIDLRSDIVSTPTPAMLEAMLEAARRPRGFGMREDVDQQELESLSATVVGMEDALFFPTCTMANQTAVMIRCSPGMHVIADDAAHICGTEGSSTAGVAGTPILGLKGNRGHLTPEQVATVLATPRREAEMRIGLVWLENTHNFAGGTVMPSDDFRNVVNIAKSHSIPVHVDGSRLWNAVAFNKVSPAETVRGADSVSFSLNKVLGAPMGAVLAGSRAFVAEAVRVRQMLGGGWRPAGILAAAGVVALRQRIDRVGEDHLRAARLADALIELNWLRIDRSRVETNIIVANPGVFSGSASDFISALREKGVLVTPHGTQNIRMVLHSDIDDEAADEVASVFRAL
jgi:threonine aldolase